MRRKWIGLLLAAVMAVLPASGLAADRGDLLTAADVERLIYTDTLAEETRINEMMNLSYRMDNSMSSRVRLGDLIVPEKSVCFYPGMWCSYLDDGPVPDILREPTDNFYQRLLEQRKSDAVQGGWHSRWICTARADENRYYVVDIDETDGALSVPSIWEGEKAEEPKGRITELKVDRLSFDFAKLATLINRAGLGRIDHILILGGATFVDAETGEYFILDRRVYNSGILYLGGDAVQEFPAETFIPVNSYIAFVNEASRDGEEAHALFRQRIAARAGEPLAEQGGQEVLKTEETDSLAPYLGQTSKYPDVARLCPGQEGERLQAVLCQLTDRGVLTGREGGNFAPTDVLRRGEAAAMVGRLFCLAPDSGGSVFSDVTPDYYAADYIGAMHQMGILNGYEDGTFQPEEAVTYSELFMMVTSLLGGAAERQSYSIGAYYPEGSDRTAVFKGLCEDLGEIATGLPIVRKDAAFVLSRALDAHLTTLGKRADKTGFATVCLRDITLAAYLDGGTLQGEVMYTRAQEKAYTEALLADWKAEYGVIKQIYSYYAAGEFAAAEALERQLAE